jgi:hypothetical protein
MPKPRAHILTLNRNGSIPPTSNHARSAIVRDRPLFRARGRSCKERSAGVEGEHKRHNVVNRKLRTCAEDPGVFLMRTPKYVCAATEEGGFAGTTLSISTAWHHFLRNGVPAPATWYTREEATSTACVVTGKTSKGPLYDDRHSPVRSHQTKALDSFATSLRSPLKLIVVTAFPAPRLPWDSDVPLVAPWSMPIYEPFDLSNEPVFFCLIHSHPHHIRAVSQWRICVNQNCTGRYSEYVPTVRVQHSSVQPGLCPTRTAAGTLAVVKSLPRFRFCAIGLPLQLVRFYLSASTCGTYPSSVGDADRSMARDPVALTLPFLFPFPVFLRSFGDHALFCAAPPTSVSQLCRCWS